MNYRLDGSGPKLLLLHPVGLDLTCFDGLVERLARGFRVLRVDLRGHGDTSPSPQGTTVELRDYADDVHTLLQGLKFSPAAVAGFSFGGMIAQELALRYPGDVSALVIAACPSTYEEATRVALRERGAAAKREGMAAVVEATLERWFSAEFRERGGDAAARKRLLSDDVEGWWQAWEAISKLETESRLPALGVPALCLAGECDVAAPPYILEGVAQRVPGAKLAIVAKAPHMMFIEYPDETAAAIAEFLRTAGAVTG